VKENGFEEYLKILEKERKAVNKKISGKFSIQKRDLLSHMSDNFTKNDKFLFVFDDIYSFQGAKLIKI